MAKPRRLRLVSQLSALCLLALFFEWSGSVKQALALLGQTSRVNVGTSSEEANLGSNSGYEGPSVSGNGRRVAFGSRSTNLVAGDTNGFPDVFVRDIPGNFTLRASVASDGSEANDFSFSPSISRDGKYIAFKSEATNLAIHDTNGFSDVFVHDTESGVTTRVSVTTDGIESNGDSSKPEISADGTHVAFLSKASNLVPNDTNNGWDVFVHNLLTGTTTRASMAWNGAEADDVVESFSISGDGRFVVFSSRAGNLVLGDMNGEGQDVFVRDLQAGTTRIASISSEGVQGYCCSIDPDISDDGRFVVFESFAPNLVLDDTNLRYDIFLRDMVAEKTRRVSVRGTSEEANGESYEAEISGDGKFVSFSSFASNLVSSDTNDQEDVFVRDLEASSTSRVSVSSSGVQVSGSIAGPGISHDGRYVVFETNATNLVESDTNGFFDTFLHDRGELDAPIISSISSSPSAISPDGDGVKDSSTISFAVTDESPPVAWTLQIKDAGGTPVQSWNRSALSGERIDRSWNGADPSGQTVADGAYRLEVTATDAWGNSSIRIGELRVDRVPPIVAILSPPANQNSLNLRPAISASLSDALSGVDLAATRIDLDGGTVAAGKSSYTPSASLTLGLHTATVTAVDLAGNVRALSWSFDVVTLTGAEATNTVTPKTVFVNPQPHPPLYSPTSVRIDGITTTLASYDVNLSSSSLWSGYGTIKRSVPHNHLRATFNNELGQSVTVHDVDDVSSVHPSIIAALEPSSGPLVTAVPESISTFSVNVAVPSTDEFVVTDESTVTVWADEQSLSSASLSAAAGDNPIPSGFNPGRYTLAADPPMVSVVGNDIDGYPYGVVTPSDGAVIYYPCEGLVERPLCAVRVLKSVNPPPSPPSSVTAQPTCNPSPCSFLFPVDKRLTMFWWTGNSLQVWASVFPIQMGDRLLLWEHTDSSAPSDSCLSLKFTRIENRLISEYSDWTIPIPDSDGSSSHFAPTIGSGQALLRLNDSGYESTRSLASGTGSGSFTSTVTAAAGSNSWCAKNVPGLDCANQVAALEHVEIATGATFAPPSTESIPYRFRMEVQWWAEVEKTC